MIVRLVMSLCLVFFASASLAKSPKHPRQQADSTIEKEPKLSIDEHWQQALTLLREGDPTAALSHLRSLTDMENSILASAGLDHSEISLLCAYAAVGIKHTQDAQTCFSLVESKEVPSPLGELRNWVGAELSALAGDDDTADRYYQTLINQGGPFQKTAAVVRYEFLKTRSRWQTAQEALSTLRAKFPETMSAEAFAFEQAMIDLELNRPDVALQSLRSIYTRAPHFEKDTRVEAALEKIAKQKNLSLAQLLSASEWKGRIDVALDKGLASAAEAAFERLSATYAATLEATYRAKTEAEIAFKKKDYAKSRRLFDAYVKHAKKVDERLWALGRLATSCARSGDIEAALKTNQRLIELAPQSASAHWARYKIAFLEMDRGHLKEALSRFSAVAKSKFKPVYHDSLWYVGWCAYKLGQYETARRFWADLSLADLKSAPRALYWQAKSYEKEGKAAEAKSRYRSVADTATENYYGILALLRLQEKPLHWESTPDAEGWWSRVPAGMVEQEVAKKEGWPPAVREALFYISRGIEEAIPASLAAAEADLVRAPSSQQLYEYLLLMWQGERYDRALSLSIEHEKKIEAGRSAFNIERYQFTYPRAWRGWVNRYSKDAHIPEALAYSIMRQESRFQPEVRSPANAIGLMQLIAPTARVVAKELAMDDFDLAHLRQPEVNIQMGTHYLGKLYGNHFNGVLPYTIAAYNAGEEAVERWVKNGQFTRENWDEFVESIPYSETNTYVKKVMLNYWMYRRLYGM